MSNRTIRFVLFNESFWDNGLVYSQNILPLMKLKQNRPRAYHVEIIVFCSILDLFVHKKAIKEFKGMMKSAQLECAIYPILFARTRYLIQKWYIIPFMLMTTLPYIFFFSIKDRLKRIPSLIYHLRSYPISFVFVNFYFGKGSLIFDPRSDYNVENKRIGAWLENSLSDKFWHFSERRIVKKANKTIFISTAFKMELLKRHSIEQDDSRYVVFYNAVDFLHFKLAREKNHMTTNPRFLYTGSLGNWNNLETYLDLFVVLLQIFPEAKFCVVTSTKKSRLESILRSKKYSKLMDRMETYFNLSYFELPKIYENFTYGVQIMQQPDSRIGVKYVEYLASGLVPIVNRNVKGAAELCDDGLGIVLENHEVFNVNQIKDKICSFDKERFAHNLRAVRSQFDVNDSYKILDLIYSLK